MIHLKPARLGLAIPMPDRGNRLFSHDGEIIDETLNYYSNLIVAGDLIAVPDTISAPPESSSGTTSSLAGSPSANPESSTKPKKG